MKNQGLSDVHFPQKSLLQEALSVRNALYESITPIHTILPSNALEETQMRNGNEHEEIKYGKINKSSPCCS